MVDDGRKMLFNAAYQQSSNKDRLIIRKIRRLATTWKCGQVVIMDSEWNGNKSKSRSVARRKRLIIISCTMPWRCGDVIRRH